MELARPVHCLQHAMNDHAERYILCTYIKYALCICKCLHEARVDADGSLFNAEVGTAQLKML